MSTFSPPQKSGEPRYNKPIGMDAKIAVLGAGVFGSWTALLLQRAGYNVTLADSRGPGNSLSSSGGESRLIRSFYGSNATYFDMASRSWDHWNSLQKDCGETILHPTGVLWLFQKKYVHLLGSIKNIMDSHSLPYEEYPLEIAKSEFSQINFDGVLGVLMEKRAGYLEAQKATKAVCNQFVKEGGTFHTGEFKPVFSNSDRLHTVDNSRISIKSDVFIFACGPWLKSLFPKLLKDVLKITRQEVYYFRIPSPDVEMYQRQTPWIDWGSGGIYYGVPDTTKGFKIAYDERGEEINPDYVERIPQANLINRSRKYMAKRFPGLKNAPLVESRICQYSNTTDGNFIIDQHPVYRNVWILGGGSGHGFKHGPAIGELVSHVIMGTRGLPVDFHIF